MLNAARTRLLELFTDRAFARGRFTLASGKESSYYINSKKAILNSEALWLLGEILWEMTRDLDLQAVGGPEVGAIPMAAAVAQRYHQEGRSLEGFFVRKQTKDHGSGERIEGVLRPGWRVAILEDVITTAASVMRSVTEVELAGASVVAVICIVDRLEGAQDLLAPRYDFLPIFTIRDFGIEPNPPG
ncbi:MAG: orotate phosphoribosyltransferase [Gemmataceae bacterium]|nr:orotate phosphoribosyltransferase [Gemmataceae bacterium]